MDITIFCPTGPSDPGSCLLVWFKFVFIVFSPGVAEDGCFNHLYITVNVLFQLFWLLTGFHSHSQQVVLMHCTRLRLVAGVSLSLLVIVTMNILKISLTSICNLIICIYFPPKYKCVDIFVFLPYRNFYFYNKLSYPRIFSHIGPHSNCSSTTWMGITALSGHNTRSYIPTSEIHKIIHKV